MIKAGEYVFFVCQGTVRYGKILSMADKENARLIDFTTMQVKKRSIYTMMDLEKAGLLKEKYLRWFSDKDKYKKTYGM